LVIRCPDDLGTRTILSISRTRLRFRPACCGCASMEELKRKMRPRRTGDRRPFWDRDCVRNCKGPKVLHHRPLVLVPSLLVSPIELDLRGSALRCPGDVGVIRKPAWPGVFVRIIHGGTVKLRQEVRAASRVTRRPLSGEGGERRRSGTV
jgi:hypothetical protein